MDFNEFTYCEKLELMDAYLSHWGTNLKEKAIMEHRRYLKTEANKLRNKSKAVSKRRNKRKANKRRQ